jgi:hypothetical protein
LLLAQSHFALGQSAHAMDDLERARDEAEALQARTSLTRIYSVLGELELARGNTDQAESYRNRSRELVEYISAHTPSEFRDAYLNQSYVRAILASVKEVGA